MKKSFIGGRMKNQSFHTISKCTGTSGLGILEYILIMGAIDFSRDSFEILIQGTPEKSSL